MKEAMDHEIMLFGKNISFPEHRPVELGGESGGNDENSSGFDRDNALEEVKVSKVGEEVEEENKEEDEQKNNKDCLTGEVIESGNHYASDDNSEITPMNEDLTTREHSKNEKDQSDASNLEQKTLKKPDKILPCPRCKSMDTKFCYYNNYNVNQPRHFCKRCQRYWTAGGTMRNVPVGAGRRKNKNSASHCQQINISESLQTSQIDALDGYNFREFKPNGTVLSFGIDSPSWESMAPVTERNTPNGTSNGCNIPHKGGENGDDCSSGSSVTTSNSMGNGVQNQAQESGIQNINGFQSPIPCLSGVPWPYMWNPSVPMPAISPSGFPMPFYPVPYWNYNVSSPWSTPWLSPTPSATHENQSSLNIDSPILGKHTRDGELLKPSTPDGKESERSVLVPKTLRIDDPEEAAKSSIWSTLGIKYDSDNKRRTMFNAFEPKYMEKKNTIIASSALQANPAALSRSLSFQEIALC